MSVPQQEVDLSWQTLLLSRVKSMQIQNLFAFVPPPFPSTARLVHSLGLSLPTTSSLDLIFHLLHQRKATQRRTVRAKGFASSWSLIE